MSHKKQCAMLIGGQGTRLGSFVQATPKPMLEVAGVPFVVHVIRQLSRYGFNDFVLLTGYKADVVDAYFSDGRVARELRVSIRCSREFTPMGTGGALLNAKDSLSDEFLLCNGDSYFDCNVKRLTLPFENTSSLGRIALRHVAHNTRYGAVHVANDRITVFSERDENCAPGFMNAGIYYLKKEVLQSIPVDKISSLERDVFPILAEQNNLEYTAFPENYFIDIGMPEDLARARSEFAIKMARPAIFFDRDGVLNVDAGYTHRKEDFRWLGDAREAILYANDHGYNVFVVTNQAGIARGYYKEDAVRSLHQYMQQDLASIGAHIDDFALCPHHPGGKVPELSVACNCRKPQPGMIKDLIAKWPIDRQRSLMVGDKQSDMLAGERSGLRTHLFTPEQSLYAIVRNHIGRADDNY